MDVDAFSSLGDVATHYYKNIALLRNHVIPECYPVSRCSHGLIFREEIIQLCGYALISYDWVRKLAAWIGERPCLEIMAGSGALSFALAQCGVNIIPTDDGTWSEQAPEWFAHPWMHVECIDCRTALQRYAVERPIVICSWPPRGDDAAIDALLQMRRINPEALMIYIGEPKDGATANDKFFKCVKLVYDEAFTQAVSDFTQFPGLHDSPYLVK